ncbi:MAG: membrane protein insertion efficiency factor YidD [Verrucomicrobiota bacterium]|nr:membrane protein insertion efficiency factor YidD [Verrucomicrobiota bacterium]
MTPIGHSLCFCIRVYQKTLSPLLGSCCRFEPSCSNYMLEAIQHHGVVYGVFIGLRRVARCHPWNAGGYDPVPPKKKPPFK